MAELLHGALTHEILGAYYDVYNALPWGLPESAYGHAMSLALSARGLVHRREVPFNVQFRGNVVCTMRADLIVERAVLVEIKAGDRLAAAHERQLIAYLQATSYEVGLLFNFGPKPEKRRLIQTERGPRLENA